MASESFSVAITELLRRWFYHNTISLLAITLNGWNSVQKHENTRRKARRDSTNWPPTIDWETSSSSSNAADGKSRCVAVAGEANSKRAKRWANSWGTGRQRAPKVDHAALLLVDRPTFSTNHFESCYCHRGATCYGSVSPRKIVGSCIFCSPIRRCHVFRLKTRLANKITRCLLGWTMPK